MPQIPEYNAPIKGLTVPATGIEVEAQAGRRLGALGNEEASMIRQSGRDIAVGLEGIGKSTEELGSAVNRFDTSTDLNNLNAHFTNRLLQLNQAQTKFYQDPATANDPNAAQTFQDKYVQPVIDEMNEGVQTKGGRAHAAELGKMLGTHFAGTGQQIQTRIAQQQTANTYQQMYNGLGVSVEQNPETLPLAIGQLQTYLNAQGQVHPDLTPDKIKENIQKARSDLTLHAGFGMIKNNPEMNVDAWAASHATDLGPGGLDHLRNYQRQEQQHLNTLNNANDVEEKKNDEAEFNFTKNNAIQRLMDGGSAVDYLNEIKRANTLPGARIHQNEVTEMYNFGKEWAKDNSKDITSETTRNEFFSRLLDDGPNKLGLYDVLRAKAEHSLSDQDTKFFEQQVNKRNSRTNPLENENVKNTDTAVRAMMGIDPGANPQNQSAQLIAHSAWFSAMSQDLEHAKEKGTSVMDTLNKWSTLEQVQKYYPKATIVNPEDIRNPGSGFAPIPPKPQTSEGGGIPAVPDFISNWFGKSK